MTIQHDRAAMPDLAISIAQLGGGIGLDLESRYPELAWVFDKARDYDEIVSEWIPPDAKVWDDADDLERAVSDALEDAENMASKLELADDGEYDRDDVVKAFRSIAHILRQAPEVGFRNA